jgi:hypothetical protein
MSSLYLQLENRVGEMRARLQALEMEAQNQLLVNTSLFQASQERLEEARLEGKEEEEAKNEGEDKKKDVAREATQVIASIKNIYGRCVGSMKFSPNALLPRDATIQQTLTMNLDVIADRIVDLDGIFQDFKLYQSSNPTPRNDPRSETSAGFGTDSQMDPDMNMNSGIAGNSAAVSADKERLGFPTKPRGSQSTGELPSREIFSKAKSAHVSGVGSLPAYPNASGKSKGTRATASSDDLG